MREDLIATDVTGNWVTEREKALIEEAGNLRQQIKRLQEDNIKLLTERNEALFKLYPDPMVAS